MGTKWAAHMGPKWKCPWDPLGSHMGCTCGNQVGTDWALGGPHLGKFIWDRGGS